jgi:hypothetical protein
MKQAPIVESNNKCFIKVIDQKLAERLIDSGFSYIKEGKFYAFAESPELTAILQKAKFSDNSYFTENLLRF